MGGGLDLWGKQQVAHHLLSLLASRRQINFQSREIAEPQKLLPYLLQPNVSLLAPETIGAYLQAAIKLFGTWSMELSQDWDSEKIQGAREVVEALISRLKDFTSHSEIEVQERVSLRGDLVVACPTSFLGRKCGEAFHFHPSRPRIFSS